MQKNYKPKILKRTLLGDKILRSKSVPLTKQQILAESTKHLLSDMRYTLRRVGGVGLAAPQVGEPLQVAIISVNAKDYRATSRKSFKAAIINPKIISSSKKTVRMFEGCLSFMDLFGEVERPSQITVEYLNEKAQKVRKRLSGLEARVFQHELDHLNGIVWVDRKTDTKSFMTRQFYLEKKRQAISKKRTLNEQTSLRNRK